MPKSNTNEILKSLKTHYLESEYDQGIDLLLQHKNEFSLQI